ncbi:hypothetical protein [Chromobacterium haemolyticum]|uniref:hypothetical protein n=1 Tax=Chromobacterium haemolyticum TaxID=394935 RepID=UPI0002EA8B74|nr:hypothetical protein [Chromobacterium haemolyticum]
MPSIAAQLFLAYQDRDWERARRLLRDDAVMLWHCSGECFRGADAIVHVNRVYPEGWSIRLLQDNLLADGRWHVVAQVDHGESRFFANSLFTLEHELISQIEEYWASAEAPPAWRVGLPGWARLEAAQPA